MKKRKLNSQNLRNKKKFTIARDAFGILKSKKSTEQLMKEIDEDLWS